MASATRRVFEMLSLFQRQTHWTSTALARHLEIDGRTVRRDIERLRAIGFPIQSDPGVGGGYRLSAGARLPPLVLDDDEAVAVAVGLRAAAVQAIAGIEATALRAMSRLERVLPAHVRRTLDGVLSAVSFAAPGAARSPVDPGVLVELSRACREHFTVEFGYTRRDGVTGERRCEPHAVVTFEGRWYLVAWDLARDDWRVFRLDRVAQPTTTEVAFLPRDLPGDDAIRFVAERWQQSPPRYRIVLMVDGSAPRVEALLTWARVEVHAVDADRARVILADDSVAVLSELIALLAGAFDVRAIDPLPSTVEAALRMTHQRLETLIR